MKKEVAVSIVTQSKSWNYVYIITSGWNTYQCTQGYPEPALASPGRIKYNVKVGKFSVSLLYTTNVHFVIKFHYLFFSIYRHVCVIEEKGVEYGSGRELLMQASMRTVFNQSLVKGSSSSLRTRPDTATALSLSHTHKHTVRCHSNFLTVNLLFVCS